MRIFLDYISRQFKKDPEYRPHPIIRAFECAFHNMEKLSVDECTVGVSHDGTNDCIYEPYAVALQKKKSGVEVKEIRNLKLDKQLPLDIMIILFRLQIQLDKIPGECTTPQQVVDALNAVIGEKFYALGDRWQEARDEFKKQLELGKIHLPSDPEILKGLTEIRYDTPWEDYPNDIRALIGSSIAPSLEEGSVVITSPTNSRIEKFKVFDIATEFMLGKSAKYLNLFGEGSTKQEYSHPPENEKDGN
ncbi:MAG: hypothetical protein P8Y63_01165 [Deltaproteobacteria bacterium]|jgi:hypothetical protein